MPNDEWITPQRYIESARKVLGEIELDPASNITAQDIVKATTYLTKAENGLKYDWSVSCSIWLNPPYSQPLQTLFIEKLIKTHDDNFDVSSILLVNNSTDTKIIQKFMSETAVLACFTRGRISFLDNELKQSKGNRQGQIFFYTGHCSELFIKEFCKYGYCTYLQKGPV